MPLPPSETGFTVDLTSLLRTGVQLNKFDAGIPFWKTVDGLQFIPGGIRRKPGRGLIIDLGTEPVRGITSVNEFETKVIYAGDLSTLYSFRLDTQAKNTVGTGYNLVEKGGSTSWDSGATTYDSGSTVWDEGIVLATQWSFTNFGKFIFATNNVNPVQVKKNNLNFNDLFDDEVSGGTVNAGGSVYAVDDTVTHTGGAGTGLTTTITEVVAGVVTAFEITAFGSGYANGDTLTQSTTSGSGTGFTLDVTVPDTLFTRGMVLAKLGPHILLFNYSKASGDFPFDFSWCSEDDTDTWIASSTNSAGSLTIREAETELKCVVPLSNGLGVYTDNQLFFVTFVGTPFFFGYRPVMTTGIGAVSISSVVAVDRNNYGLSRTGLFKTDGATVQIIGEDEGINDFLKENLAELEQIVGYHDQTHKEITWSIPVLDTKPTQELYYNYRDNTFGQRTSDISAFHEAGVFLNPISGDVNGQLFFEDGSSSAQSTSGTTRAHDLGAPDSFKELTSIRVGKRGNGSPLIEIGWSENINDTPIFTDSFTVNTTFKEELLRTAGRYLFLRITSSNPSDSWEITHMIVQGRLGGTR